MRFPTFLTMALVPAALVAQAPTDYMQIQKAEAPGIEALLKDFKCLEALKQAEALLPASLPAFDKTNANAAMKSSISFSGLTRLYLLAGRASVQAGEWEKAKDYDLKAQDCAKVNYENTKAALTPIITNWTDATAKAQAFVTDNGDRIKAIQAKPALTPEEEKFCKDFQAKDQVYNTTKNNSEKNDAAKWLTANQPHYKEVIAKVVTPAEQQDLANYKVAQDNLVRGPKVIKSVQDNIDAPKAELDACQTRIDAASKALGAEAEETAKNLEEFKVKGKLVKETSGPKFDEKKAKYFESLLNTRSNYDNRPNKIDKMNFLFRLKHNVAGTALEAKVDAVIDRVRQDQDPLPPEKKAHKSKKA